MREFGVFLHPAGKRRTRNFRSISTPVLSYKAIERSNMTKRRKVYGFHLLATSLSAIHSASSVVESGPVMMFNVHFPDILLPSWFPLKR